MDRIAALRGSDLHISVGIPPIGRINGQLHALSDETVTPLKAEQMARQIMNPLAWEEFTKKGEHDFSVSVPGKYRFRANAFMQRQSISLALRFIVQEIPSIDKLGLPPVAKELCRQQRGLILVTGPTGSGKSTTLASMIDLINNTRDCHIITIEDPIEYLHRHKKCIINQREVGSDTHSYAAALRVALRQDPDVILIGEMRDLETISIALTAAETGHLVLSTLHTIGAAKTVDRIIDVFPPHQQEQIRVQLSMTLVAVLSQQLMPNVNSSGRTAAIEIMLSTPAIRNLIRENKTPQIVGAIQTSSMQGMQLMDNAIAAKYKSGEISRETAISFASDREYLTKLLF
jgi:twitching motility protein PilT